MDSVLKELRELTQALREQKQAGEKEAREKAEADAAAAAASAAATTATATATADPNEERWAAFLTAGVKNASDARELDRQERVYGKCLTLGRMVRAIGAAGLKKDFSREGPLRILQDVFKDRAVTQMMERALSVGTPSEGGYLIQQVLGTDMVELLRDQTVIMDLGAREIEMPEGNLTLPRQSAGSTFTYKPEGGKITSSQPTVGDVKWNSKKLTGNIPISNDLLRLGTSPMADALVRDDAVAGIAVARDNAGLNGLASVDTPLGVLNDPDVTQVTIGEVIDADNISKFLLALLNAKVNFKTGKFGWAINPTVWYILYNAHSLNGQYYFRDELDRGMLLGYKYGRTTLIANGVDGHVTTKIAFGNWAEYLIALQGGLEAAVSSEASYYDADGNIQSTWGKDQTVMRFIERHDMRMRQAAAMAVSSDVYTVA